MKFVTAAADGKPFAGVLLADEAILSLDSHFTSLQSLIEGGADALTLARSLSMKARRGQVYERSAARILAPLPVPASIRDCTGFEDHLKNCIESALNIAASGAADPIAERAKLRATGRYSIADIWYRQPLFYKGNRFAVSGPDTDIQWPSYSKIMDFELEIACVVGVLGRDIDREDAAAHIFGYTIFNDFSARDTQIAEQAGGLGPAKGKDFDGANAMGPVIVTADEIGDVYNLPMRARVDGELWCDASSDSIHWRFEDMIAHISASETIHPGEIIGSGTVSGGCGLERQRFLQSGAVVELEVPPIGILRNRVWQRQREG